MKILKFGGTSVGSTEMIVSVADIVAKTKEKSKVMVVVSAMSGVTNTLLELCEAAGKGDISKSKKILEELRKKHSDVAHELCDGSCDLKIIREIEDYISNLEDIIRGITLLRQISDRGRAKVLYFGEIFSSLLVSLAINQKGIKSKNYFSRDLLESKGNYMDGVCDEIKSEKQLKKFKAKLLVTCETPVITGFGGGDKEGNIYLFDRGGSDYVASLIGAMIKAKAIEIWTDVDGVMSADPRVVDDVVTWKKLDFAVCAEFALVGAKVLHPKTISPAQRAKVPVWIKNTFNPKGHGTKICTLKDKGVKGINVDTKQYIYTFVDPSMIGHPGYIADALGIFKKNHISVDTLATTETSFSVSIRKRFYDKNLIKEFKHLEEHFDIDLKKDIVKISLVGDTIDSHTILQELKNVVMVSQGAHQKSLTVFVEKCDEKRLLKKLHKIIFTNN